ncbi:MAG TPA: RNA 2',3'-cyclic phosphodiesterase [Polyangia bacterium]|nr:RNA 2',3'-cyclic phosphodiesterase [Polyangia bacterium]
MSHVPRATAPQAPANEENQVRSFVAVPLPAEVQAAVLAAATELSAQLPDVKWTRKPENLHVTMAFLGDVAPAKLDALGAALMEKLAERQAFPVTLQGFGAFPEEASAHTLWAGVQDSEGGLRAIAAELEDVTSGLGLPTEKRAFRPHVTVGRCKRGVDARRVFEPWRGHRFATVTVDAVNVYESRRQGRGDGQGSTYVLRGQAPLRAGRDD